MEFLTADDTYGNLQGGIFLQKWHVSRPDLPAGFG